MKQFSKITSPVVPLSRRDVDTDQIISAQHLTSVASDGFGRNLFRNLRDADPSFPLNDERYAGAKILCAADNFGCGSSREHAVWALLEYGFRAVIAKSFADIFSANAANNGLLLVTLPAGTVDRILAEAAGGKYEVTVDLSLREVRLPGGTAEPFAYDPFRQHCLLHGLDPLDYILSHQRDIDAYSRKRAGSAIR
jgi:3-isopropylmalate/(R)-2-methylmalate dehydratase small subunit